MRIGQNPLREKQAPYEMKDIIFLVVTHLPSNHNGRIEGDNYHGQRFEVVKTCLETMRNNSHREHTFVVWDNDSGEEFTWWLQSKFDPDILILSKNIGKNQARAAAIQMMPLGSIVCYSDDDIFYYDNWLNPQIELLNHFPNVACVTGMPIRTMQRWGNENTLKWARANAKVKQGQFIPREWENDFADSIGRSHEKHIEMTIKDFDYLIEYEGKSAYAHGHHAQFIGYVAQVRNAIISQDDMAMSDEKPTDIELDKVGLRLCTTQRYARHIGNVLDDNIRKEYEQLKERV